MRFDSIFMTEFKNGMVYIQVSADGEPWRRVEMPISDLKDKTFFDKLKELVEKAPMNESERSEYPCPSCGSKKATFLRGYKRWRFCGFCGAHLRLTKTGLDIICKR